MIVNSPAKLNLYLRVINKRKDNYHNICTVFERIDLADTLILKPRRDTKITVACSDKAVPVDKTNLAWQAASLLQKSFKVNKGVDIRIIKRIPVGAGLGGGSSNAASALKALNTLWGLRLGREKLIRLAASIGSDVAFFIHDRAFSEGRGRGEKIAALPGLDKVKLWHVLAVPELQVSTPYIYKKWDTLRKAGIERAGLTSPGQDVKILLCALKNKDLGLLRHALFNNLEGVTLKIYPQVRRLKDRLKSLGMESVLMSGSGPAVFAIAASRKEAVSLCGKLKAGDTRVFAVRPFQPKKALRRIRHGDNRSQDISQGFSG